MKYQNHSHIGLHWRSQGLTLAHIRTHNKISTLEKLINLEEPTNQNKQILLKKAVIQNKLQRQPATLLLPHEDYQMFLIESPLIFENEKKSALKWSIAEFIDFPLEDAVVDYIDLPKNRNEDINKMYVIVTNKNKLETYIKWIKESDLKLVSIDIEQNALCKIAYALEDCDEGQALLHFENEKAQLILFKNRSLYMMRELNLSSSSNDYMDVALEIQRSIDFCQSNLKNIPISRIILTPNSHRDPSLLTHLSNNLGMPVREMNFNEVLKNGYAGLKNEDAAFAIGAALKDEH